MLRKLTWIFLMLALVGVMFGQPSVGDAQGQKATVITYGEIVNATITNEAYEQMYRFSGSAGDVIIAEVKRYYGDDSSAPTLDEPSVTLTDPTGFSTLAEGYGTAFLSLQLTTTGDHLLVVSRRGGASGTSVGNFQLALIKPEPLVPFTPLASTITNTETQYFWINATDELRFTYQRTAGTFAPEVTVITTGEFGPTTMALIDGSLIEAASIDLRIPSEGLFFVRVTESLYDFNFDPVEAEYKLELVVRKGIPITQ